MKEKKYSNSISGRLLRRIIVVMLITMAVTTGVVFLFAMAGMSAMANVHFEDILKITDERVSAVLKAVEVSAVNNVDEISKHLNSPEQVMEALESEMRLNPHIVGSAAAFEPGYYRSKGRWFEPYAHRKADGSIEMLQIGSSAHDYLQAPWYQNGLTSDNGYWSDPYYDEAGAKDLLCTYALPLKDESGRAVGVLGADISLAWAADQLKGNDRDMNELSYASGVSEDGSPEIYSFILGRRGEYLFHPDTTRVLHTDFFAYAPEGRLKEPYERIGRAMIAGERGIERVTFDGEDSYVFYAPLMKTGWSMAVVVPFEVVVTPGLAVGAVIIMVLVLGLLVAFFLVRGAIRRTMRPIKFLAHSAEEVAKGRFDTPLPKMYYNDEIHQLRDSFANMQLSLTQYIDELKGATAHQAAIDNELDIARGIQMSMLPSASPASDGIEVCGRLTPAKAVGGDFYDYFRQEGRLYFCIGDVSGKGVPASLVMAIASAEFRTLSAGTDLPERIVSGLNEALTSRNESMMFVTLFAGVLDLATGVLRYCNAGHDAPLLIGGDGDVRLMEVEPNLPLGVMPGLEYVRQQVTLKPGTTVFLYTDGLTEAEDAVHAQFGMDRILETARQAVADDPSALIERMTEAVHGFVAGAEQSDDLTLLAIRYSR